MLKLICWYNLNKNCFLGIRRNQKTLQNEAKAHHRRHRGQATKTQAEN